jgi:phage tail sheath protein FI
MAVDRARRTGGVARLIGIVMRAARWLGQGLLFDASGPVLWTRVRRELDGFLTGLWRLGALDGASPDQAFTVRCDTSTMSQADLDAGRVVATIELAPAQPVERITVTLALSDGGDGLEAQEAA